MVRGGFTAALLLALLLGACLPSPSRSPTDVPTSVVAPSEAVGQPSPPPSAATAATAVTGSLPHTIQFMTDRFEPLPADKLPLVRITAKVAAGNVLAYERETGWPDFEIAWRNGDCTFVAWYVPGPMSMAPVPPPPSAVYLVRLVADDAWATGELQVTWVMVDATTGDVRSAFGSGLISGCADI